MRSLNLFSAVAVVAVLGVSSRALTQEAALVVNDDHEVKVVRVELTGALHGGRVQPPSADEAFLLVFLETDDPCFDFERNQACFSSELSELDKVAWACGELMIAEDDVRPADGGGLLDGELACSFLVPANASDFLLRLRGYPEISLEPKGHG